MDIGNLDFGTKTRAKKFSFTEDVTYHEKKVVKKPRLEDKVEIKDDIDELFDSKMIGEPFNPVVKEQHVVVDVENFEEEGGDEEGNQANKLQDEACGDAGWQSIMRTELHDLDDIIDREDNNEEVKELPEMKTEIYEDYKKAIRLEGERRKLEQAVKKLTLLDNKNEVDHQEALANTAQSLNHVRNAVEDLDLSEVELNNLKLKISVTEDPEEMIQILRSNSKLKMMISDIDHSSILEQLLRVSAVPDNPLNDFPMDINRNHYSDIINFGMNYAPDAIGFILKMVTRNDAPIAEIDVVRCAYMFSALACSVSRVNNALKKTKTAITKSNGLTNVGLDELATAGIFETSRSFRNDRDMLASLNEHILKSYAQNSVAQITFDNMDLTVGGIMHHMTLPFLEFETENTSFLSTDEKTFEDALDYFNVDTVLITSGFNENLLEHYKYVTAWTLGRLFGEEVEGFSWLKQVFPKHYQHPNSGTSSRKSTIFVQKPLNYSENSNNDMIKIMESLQWKYLNLVGEQSNDKEAFFTDLNLIYSVEVDKDVRERAEIRVKEEVKIAGELICHGDLLTDVRFESCKRLRRMGVSAVERFDFLKIFRLGTFHMHMNKIMQDIVAGMKAEVNVDDVLSLGYFKTVLGLQNISNSPDVIKKDGNYEYHSQFCEEIGTELLIGAFKTFADKSGEPVEKTEKAAVKFILDFLEEVDIKYHYDPENIEEKDLYDDMMTSCKDNAARTVISLVLNSVEHEGDGLGLRALRTVMIPYFLNKKENVQDSKYAARLLFNRVWFLQSSERTKARIDLLACCNPSGKQGHSIARDMENEHKVRSTKEVLRGQHSQLGDLTVEKAVLGSNILELIRSHDRQAMLLQEGGGRKSYRYLSEAVRLKVRAEVDRVKPFEYNREKVEYYDKPRGVFSGLTLEKIDRFLTRNKGNFSRNTPHKPFLLENRQCAGNSVSGQDIVEAEGGFPLYALGEVEGGHQGTDGLHCGESAILSQGKFSSGEIGGSYRTDKLHSGEGGGRDQDKQCGKEM